MMNLFRSGSKSSNELEMKSIDTVIGPNTVFNGTLQSDNSVCIEGEFFGHLASKGGVLINGCANIKADIFADYVVVHGKVTGNITAMNQLDITATGQVRGDVQAPSVIIAKGGVLDGFCRMAAPTEKELEFQERRLPEPSDEANDGLDDIIVPLEMGDPFQEDQEEERIHIIPALGEKVPALDSKLEPFSPKTVSATRG